MISLRNRGLTGTLIYVLVCAALFTGSVVLVGGVIREVVFEEVTTFWLERITSSSLLGREISRYDSLGFAVKVASLCIKLWLFLSLVMFAFLHPGKSGDGGRSYAWTARLVGNSFAPVLTAAAVWALAVRGLGFFIPLYQSYLYFIPVAGLFLVYLPVRMYRQAGEETGGNLPLFRLFFSYFFSLGVIVLLWSFNHYNFSLLRMV